MRVETPRGGRELEANYMTPGPLWECGAGCGWTRLQRGVCDCKSGRGSSSLEQQLSRPAQMRTPPSAVAAFARSARSTPDALPAPHTDTMQRADTDLGPREARAWPTIRSSWVQARATMPWLGPLMTTGAPCAKGAGRQAGTGGWVAQATAGGVC